MIGLETAVERPDGARVVRPAGRRRDVPQHGRQHAHPGRAVRRQGPGAREQLRQRASSASASSSRRCSSRSWTGGRRSFLLAGLFVIGLLDGAGHARSRACRPATSSRWRSRCWAGPRCSSAPPRCSATSRSRSSMNTWSKPYMTELLGGVDNPTAVANAGFVLSLFGVAMMAGRFVTSTVKNLTAIGVKLVLVAALVVGGAPSSLMIQTSSPAVAIGGRRAHRPRLRPDLPDDHRRHVREVRAEPLRQHLRHHVLGRPARRDVRPEDRRQPERGRDGPAEPDDRPRAWRSRCSSSRCSSEIAGRKPAARRRRRPGTESQHGIDDHSDTGSSAPGSSRSSTWRRSDRCAGSRWPGCTPSPARPSSPRCRRAGASARRSPTRRIAEMAKHVDVIAVCAPNFARLEVDRGDRGRREGGRRAEGRHLREAAGPQRGRGAAHRRPGAVGRPCARPTSRTRSS